MSTQHSTQSHYRRPIPPPVHAPGNHLLVTIDQEHLKHFAAFLNLLQKIGKEVVIEAEGDVFTLRSLNDSKSAFISIEIRPGFFRECVAPGTSSSFACKVLVKPLCNVFRNLKTITSMTIRAHSTEESKHELEFEMHSSSGVVRRHKFHYADCEIMNADFDDETASYLKSDPKVFTQLLDHFHQSPELSIEATRSRFTVKSYHQDEALVSTGTGSSNASSSVSKKYMRTGAEVNVSEFSEYHFYGNREQGQDDDEDAGEDDEEYCEELVVCSKEVRALLNYCEVTETPNFYLFFTCGGRPVKLSGGSRVDVKVELILATLETRRQAIRQNEQANRQTPSAHAPAPRRQQQQQQQQQQSSSSRQQPQQQQRQQRQQQPEERGRGAPVLTDESEQVVTTVDARRKKKRLMDDSDDDN